VDVIERAARAERSRPLVEYREILFAEAPRTIQRQPCGPAQSPLGMLSTLLFRASAFSSFASTEVSRGE
jgi:hypothetical protein